MKKGQYQEEFLAGIVAAVALGIFVAVHCNLAPALPMVLLAIAVALSVYAIRREKAWAFMAILLAFFFLGSWRFLAADKLPANDISHFAGQQATIEGTLRDEVQEKEDGRGGWQYRYVLAVQRVRPQGSEVKPASGGLSVTAHQPKRSEKKEQPQIGDKVRVTGEVRVPHGYQNPGQLNTVQLLKNNGITALLSAGKRGIAVQHVDASPVKRWLVRIREHYRSSMEQVMPQEDAAAIFAMLFGGYNGINAELLQNFTATGIVHILSVSGSHISLLAAVMAYLGRLLHLPKGVTAVAVITVIALYSVLSGCVPPVIRSAIMGSLTFIALSLEREKDARHILLLTGLVMLLLSPSLLLHISFQLSYLATAGLLFLAPALHKFFLQHKLPEFIAGSFAITIAAQLATTPILLWYFNQISLSSVLANLIVVPILELMIVFGLFAGLVALLLPFLGSLIFAMDSLLLGIAAELTSLLAKLPGSQVYLPTMNVPASLLYYAILGFFLLPAEKKAFCLQKIWTQRCTCGIVIIAILGMTVIYSLLQPAKMSVHFVDVGQGDCVLVITPHGHALLFDTGGTRDNFDVGDRVTVPYLRHVGATKLDAVFLSHAHEDHAAGCAAVLKELQVGKVYTADEGRAAYAHSMKFSENEPLLQKLTVAQQGQVMQDDGVKIEVLFAPQKQDKSAAIGNECSNVYRVTYGTVSFLITGDLTKENEAELLAEGIQPQSTVLKAGHHGSETSSSDEFLAAVQPKFAVFCVGFGNQFGHPKPKILERYQEHHIKSYRTDCDGLILMQTDGKKLSIETFREEQRKYFS